MFIKCLLCGGKGKIKGSNCPRCFGTRTYFHKEISTKYPPPWDKNANGIPDWIERGYGGIDGNPNTPF